MAALRAGILAPDFSLPTVHGQQVSLAEALRKGPVVLVFFKVSCPVCQYALPFIERVYRANRGGGATVLGVSQDDAKKTLAFMREFGVSFTVALDDTSHYAVSNAYGLTNVPTIFYIAATGEIELSVVSWSKRDVEAINERLAAFRRQPTAPLWQQGEDIRDFRAG